MQNTGGVCAEKAGQRLCPLHAYGGSEVADSDPGGQSSLTADEQGQELLCNQGKGSNTFGSPLRVLSTSQVTKAPWAGMLCEGEAEHPQPALGGCRPNASRCSFEPSSHLHIVIYSLLFCGLLHFHMVIHIINHKFSGLGALCH